MSRPLLVLLLTLAVPLDHAIAKNYYGEDGSVCTDEQHKLDVANIAKARKLEQGGDYRQAYETLGDTGCLWATDDEKAYDEKDREADALRIRLYKELGDEAEKKGQFQQAFDWYGHDQQRYIKDQERVMLKMAKAKPDDYKVIKTAFDFFKGNRMADSLKATGMLAVQNAKPWLVEEDQQFQSKQSELYHKAYGSLEQAQKWLEFVDAPENRMAAERAEKRGDSMASQTTPYYLEEAIKYYRFAGKTEKIKSIQGKAKKLGDEAKGRGENHLAVDYYMIAGSSEQAQKLRKATEAQENKDESKRQKQFKKDQDKLEDELGL